MYLKIIAIDIQNKLNLAPTRKVVMVIVVTYLDFDLVLTHDTVYCIQLYCSNHVFSLFQKVAVLLSGYHGQMCAAITTSITL